MGSWARNTFVALNNREYRLLFLGTALAQLAFGMMNVVQGIVAFDLTGKNSAVGFVSLGMGISMLTLGPFGGTLSDRVSKRRLLLFSQSVIGVMFGVIGVMIVTGAITIWLLACSTLVMGSMFAIMGPARQAWVGDLLEGPELSNGIALQQIAMNGTRIFGPFIAGALVAISFIDTGGTYLAMSVVFVFVVFMLSFMPKSKPAEASGRSMISDLRLGFLYIWRTPDLRLLTLVFSGTVLTGFSYQTIMPGFLENELGHPAKDLGLIYGVAAVGGIIVTIILAGRAGHSNVRKLMFAFGLLLAASLIALSFAPGFWLALAAMVAVGACSSGFQLLNNVNLMERCDQEYYGRVMSVTMMSFGLQSIAAYPIGLSADRLGERPAMLILACAALVVLSVGMLGSIKTAKSVAALPPRVPKPRLRRELP